MTLANKTVVVTGCCSGIGADFALAIACIACYWTVQRLGY